MSRRWLARLRQPLPACPTCPSKHAERDDQGDAYLTACEMHATFTISNLHTACMVVDFAHRHRLQGALVAPCPAYSV